MADQAKDQPLSPRAFAKAMGLADHFRIWRLILRDPTLAVRSPFKRGQFVYLIHDHERMRAALARGRKSPRRPPAGPLPSGEPAHAG